MFGLAGSAALLFAEIRRHKHQLLVPTDALTASISAAAA